MEFALYKAVTVYINAFLPRSVGRQAASVALTRTVLQRWLASSSGWEPFDNSDQRGPGFDIRSLGPADPATGHRPVRRIEVKGRARGQRLPQTEENGEQTGNSPFISPLLLLEEDRQIKT